MTRIIRLLAFLAGLLPAIAAAQSPSLPANTVWGRLGIGTGPGEAIPFAVLSSKLSGAIITLNSGNGQTAPGAMSGGNTYSFGANTDTVRMTGLGLGGAAPATGLQIYNAPVNPGAGGQGSVGASSTNGGGLIGQGSVYDSYLGNLSGTVALGVTTGTQNVVFLGGITAASLSTAGTVGGSVCMTSAGLMLYKAGVNCFTVSGIVVANGKTLTVNNTLTLNGTDGTTFTYPGATDTLAGLGTTQTFTSADTFSGTFNCTGTCQLSGSAFGTFATQNYATPPAIGGTTPNTGAFSTLSATTPIGLASGGTNAGTAAGARASGGLNVDSYTAKGDTNYTIVATDRTVGTSATLTAARTWTLPGASAVNAGQELLIIDMVGGVTNTNTITIARAGSDTINGGTSVTISVSNGAYLLKSDGVSRWTAQQLGAQATVGVSSINGQTGNPSIVAGTAISVSTSGGNIQVTNSGVTSMNTLTGAVTLLTEPQGRLTLTANTPVMSASATAQTTLRYDCYIGKQVPYYTGSADALDTISSCEVTDAMVSAASAGQVVSGNVYDVWWEGNTNHNICLAMSASSGGGGGWSSDTGGSNTARGTGYTQLDRITRPYITNKNSIANCFNGATNYGSIAANKLTYLGTVYASGNGQVSWTLGASASGGTAALLGVWNAYSRVNVTTTVTDSGTSYTYSTATIRQARASAGNEIQFVLGLQEDGVQFSYGEICVTVNVSAAACQWGVGFDVTNAFSLPKSAVQTSGAVSITGANTNSGVWSAGVGLHTLAATESGDGSNANTFDQSSNNSLMAALRM